MSTLPCKPGLLHLDRNCQSWGLCTTWQLSWPCKQNLPQSWLHAFSHSSLSSPQCELAHFFIIRFTGFAFNMGKWNLLPNRFRAKPAARNVQQAASPSRTQPVAPQPIPPTALTQAPQGNSASITASENQPLELAIRRHLSQIPEAEKEEIGRAHV